MIGRALFTSGDHQATNKRTAASPENSDVNSTPETFDSSTLPTAQAVHQNNQQPVFEAAPNPESLEARLLVIGDRVGKFVAANRHYPNGGVESGKVDSDWSWIAQLEKFDQSTNIPILWNQRWNDRRNDSFVRRRLDTFLNPEVDQKVGEDRYPATHFAGVSGVGADAIQLPKDHPRAGIVSPFRTVELEDIRDGTSQTMLVVGVQNQLGSWARGGASTTRSFISEPYINGPDGIGTGHENSMLVLMADGSVKQVSAEADPAIVRAMAAMSDGKHASQTPSVPASEEASSAPTHSPTLPSEEIPQPSTSTNTPAPVLIEQRLKVSLRKYHLEVPTTVGSLLREFSELAGVPIEVNDLNQEHLERPVQLSLMDVDLRALLDAIVEQAGLSFEVQSQQIRVFPAEKKSIEER